MNVIIVANTVIHEFHKYNLVIRPMKLQKILYFFIGFLYKITDKYIIEEDFMKFDYGPVIIEVYKKFKKYTYHPITKLADVSYNQQIEKHIYDFSESKKNVLVKIIEHYGHVTDKQLSNMTHKNSSPWAEAYLYNAISSDNIKSYFKGINFGEY